MTITIKSEREIALMRQAGKIVAVVLAKLVEAVQPGLKTKELDIIAEREIRNLGGIPSFKGYHGYPHALCTSVNEEVVHGMPSRSRRLKEGDIISIDYGVVVDGYYGDAAITVPVGHVDQDATTLCAVAEAALHKGIEQARVSNHLSDISHAIQSFVEQHGFSVVREFVGHGIGQRLHESPQVPNYGPPGKGIKKTGPELPGAECHAPHGDRRAPEPDRAAARHIL